MSPFIETDYTDNLNRLNPKKLLLTKWKAIKPGSKQKHSWSPM